GAPDLDEDEAPPLGDDPAPMLDAEDELELLVEAEPDAPADDAPLLLETEAEPEPPAEDAALSAEPESPPDEAPLLLDAEADAAKHDDAALVEEDPPFDPPDEQDEAFGPPHLLTEIAPAQDELLLTPAPQPKSAGRTL